MRPIGHRLRLTIECHVLAVGHDADNFARHVLVFHVNRHALANWVFAGQVLTRKCFVDDDDVALIGSLLRSEKTTLPKRNLHCREIVRVSYAHSGSQPLSRRQFGPAFNINAGARVWPIEREKADRSD